MQLTDNARSRHWCLEDIRFFSINRDMVRDDRFLFLTLASASFVEILSETYADNLIQHFQGDVEITDWLRDCWQRDEVQHGRALKMYVQAVWPEFNWDRAYQKFCKEYGALCTAEQLEQQQALELIARCVIETGTSSFYRALQSYVQEPVLCTLLDMIRSDETSHYVHFRRYFEAYNGRGQFGPGKIIATIWRRLRAISGEDSYIAFKHVHSGCYPGRQFLESDWRSYSQKVKRLARRHYPYSVAVKMLVKPIPLSDRFKKLLQWPLVGVAVLISLV